VITGQSQMSFVDIVISDYKFSNFRAVDAVVSFAVGTIEGRDVSGDDANKIVELLHHLGKWENLLKTSLNLISELKIRPVDQTTLQYYQKEFGSEKYHTDAKLGKLSSNLAVTMHLESEERRKREALGIDHGLHIEEIYDQLKNIPKWISFKKMLELIRTVT